MALLPSFFVLQSGGKYLSLTEKAPPIPHVAGFLKFDGEEIWSPRVKFAVEPSETSTGLVHIRSCYNNKYLVTKQIENNVWIVACAKKPEEDESKDSCTLFEPYSSLSESRKEGDEEELEDTTTTTTTTKVCLRHIQTRISATHLGDDDTQQGGVLVVSATGSVFNAIDWNSLVILPTNVAFSSEELTDSLLASVVLDGRFPYQRFETGREVADPRVDKQLVRRWDGTYRVYDGHFGKYWTGANDWIWAEAESNNNSNMTWFSFVKISDQVLGLRNVGKNLFCGIRTAEGKTNVLRASYPNLSRQTLLTVKEVVLKREISDFKYRLSDARIYGEHIQEVIHLMASNRSPNQEARMTFNYTEKDSRTTSWTNSMSMSFGASIKFQVTIIPLIVSGNVTLSTQFRSTHEWGVTETRETKTGSTKNVTVPASTSVKVTMLCTQAAYDVPFSYEQRDLLTNGQWVATTKHDGLFTGVNSYNFRERIEEVPLDI